MAKQAEYALYKGDELLTIGTAEEIARERGVLKRTIYHYSTPSYQHNPRKKGTSKRLVAIKLDD